MLKLIKLINRAISYILIVLMATIVLDVSWQVFTRFILKNPSSFTEELAGFLLIWIGLLGASHALYTKSHLGIDVLTYTLKGLKRKVIDVLIYSLVALFAFFVMVMGGIKLVQLTLKLDQISAAMEIPMGYVYLVLPLSGLLMILYSIGFIFAALTDQTEQFAEHQISALD